MCSEESTVSELHQNRPLLDDVFGKADTDLAAASLRHTLAAARWRRARRRLRGASAVVALLAVVWFDLHRDPAVSPNQKTQAATSPHRITTQPLPEGMLVRSQPGGLNLVSTQPGGFLLVSTRDNEVPVKLVDDDQLLLLAGRSAALVRAVGERAMLIFTGGSDPVNPH
jgi:hypothetical protein